MNYLEIMKNVLPIGPDQWAEVASQHSILIPRSDIDSIRQKYHILHKRGILTGDPLCPAELKLAKKVKYNIGIKVDLGGDEDKYNLKTSTFGNES